MNTILKHNLSILTASALLAGSVACSGDDGDDGKTTPPTGNVITGDVTDLTGRGNWGGLIISGSAINNQGDQNGELTSEASPPDSPRYFGGTNDADNSGTLQYAVIAESGFEFQMDEEVQGLTLEAIGRGTTIDHVQILGSEDDCIEWFGGTVNVSHAVCNGVDDDGLDLDEGYTGNIQFAIVRMGAQNGDRGIESDSKFDELPITAPNIANVTILGNAGKADNDTYGALHRENFGGKIFRSVYTDDTLAGTAFEDGCVDVDDLLNPTNEYHDTVFNCSPAALHDDDDTPDEAGDPAPTGASFQIDAMTAGQFSFEEDGAMIVMDTLAVMTTAAAPSVALPAGMVDAQYHGAVDPTASEPWWTGWTFIDPAVDGGLPGAAFHPLQDDIEGGDITPADTHACASVNADFLDGGFVTVFGKEFPVCIITRDITEDTSLPNSHVFVYGDFINVGTGQDQLSGGTPSTSPTLTIAAGTQIYAQQNQGAFLVITRGAKINAVGTADMPIIFGAVPMDL